MRRLLFILLIFPFCTGYTQDSLFLSSFTKSFERALNIPSAVYDDTSANITTLLKIEVNNNSQIVSMSFSDNAPDWMIHELEKVKRKLETKEIHEYAKINKAKKLNIVFPVIIENKTTEPRARNYNFPSYNAKHYYFKGELLKGECLFIKPLEMFIWGSYR